MFQKWPKYKINPHQKWPKNIKFCHIAKFGHTDIVLMKWQIGENDN